MDGLTMVSVLLWHFWCFTLTKMGLVRFGEDLWLIGCAWSKCYFS